MNEPVTVIIRARRSLRGVPSRLDIFRTTCIYCGANPLSNKVGDKKSFLNRLFLYLYLQYMIYTIQRRGEL